MSFSDHDEIVLPTDSGPKPLEENYDCAPVQLIIKNNDCAPLEENIQQVLLELSGEKIGLDFVAVLDVSSSMEGDKFAKMKIAMLLLMKNLSFRDRLSIVEYSSKAKRLCPLRQLTKSSQTELENLIDDLKAQPGTNITDGLKVALNVLQDRSVSIGRDGVIMLMSDGKQNQGDDAADVPVGNVHVLTFGFGEDQNPEVLFNIADNSGLGGSYTDVSMDNLNLTFAHCLDELQRLVVLDLMMTVSEIRNESTIKRVSAERCLQSIDNATGSVTITFGTLYIHEVCTVLVDILLPVTKKDHEAHVLEASYTYRSILDGELCVARTATITVHRMSELTAEKQQPGLKVSAVEIHLLIVEVIQQATGSTNKEDLRSVRDKLVRSLKTMDDENYIRNLKFKLRQLRAELDELSEFMQSQAINEKQGSSSAYSLLISYFTNHESERGNNNDSAFPAIHEFLEEAKRYHKINDLQLYTVRYICALECIELIIETD